MKIIADRKILLDAARTAAKAATNTNSSIPEIAGVLLEADIGGVVKLTATNLESYIQKHVSDIKVLDGGSAVIDAALLCNMLRLLGGETVSIEVDERLTCVIKSGNASYTIITLSPNKFPKFILPFPEDTIRVVGLPRLIRQTIFATADVKTQNPALQGVQIIFTSGSTSAAATDGSRFALAKTDKCADGTLDMILHQNSLGVLMSVIRPDDELYVGIADKSVVMFKEGFIFTARLLENTFVDVNKLISSVEKVYGATCDSKDLFASFDLVNAMSKYSSDKFVHLAVGDKCVNFSVFGENGSTSHSAKATNTVQTPAEGFYYSPGLIMDFLKYADGNVNLSINEKGFLILDTDGYQYVVVPRRKPVPKKEKKPELQKEKKTKIPKNQATKAA